MTDKLFAALGMATLIGFLLIVIVKVAEPALAIVVGIVIAMALFDFYRELFRGQGR